MKKLAWDMSALSNYFFLMPKLGQMWEKYIVSPRKHHYKIDSMLFFNALTITIILWYYPLLTVFLMMTLWWPNQNCMPFFFISYGIITILLYMDYDFSLIFNMTWGNDLFMHWPVHAVGQHSFAGPLHLAQGFIRWKIKSSFGKGMHDALYSNGSQSRLACVLCLLATLCHCLHMSTSYDQQFNQYVILPSQIVYFESF